MIGFLDREKTLSEPSVPMSTSLTGHNASRFLVKVTLPLLLDSIEYITNQFPVHYNDQLQQVDQRSSLAQVDLS